MTKKPKRTTKNRLTGKENSRKKKEVDLDPTIATLNPDELSSINNAVIMLKQSRQVVERAELNLNAVWTPLIKKYGLPEKIGYDQTSGAIKEV